MDIDGYPEEDEIKRVVKWDHNDCKGLMAYVKSLWWMPGWGWSESPGEKKGTMIYNISTGGWSGNEELIGALKSNPMFWLLCWVQSRRGGHYIFEVKSENKKRKGEQHGEAKRGAGTVRKRTKGNEPRDLGKGGCRV